LAVARRRRARGRPRPRGLLGVARLATERPALGDRPEGRRRRAHAPLLPRHRRTRAARRASRLDGAALGRGLPPRIGVVHGDQPPLHAAPRVRVVTNLVYVGWNHRGAPLELRERLAFTPDRAVEALEGLFREEILTEGAIVSTCNRAEIYGIT